ncbi:uncharacterized protein SPPG_08990 [Spizellomyces punctatus DAOM BR117]|uniref:Uncharacterized protein n=1 Tax=Spizellomyces punctatus (strain DAOM BR117) TaxID=645134 RepID=A0A0L0HQ68_SPIPD|nr:uncharacterized protein SPPG_08990 [Spizellomyces punctatus DAOM BR117]KND03085.1 hypothetical protein SPPG_08990 [Spizellomyces punctatus DAOM BR117]|eukprot:XP_016611124.1 hypothetical protein SPPG_08990 [Spizellomyces punctatus DAOM BR117]
MSSNTEYLDTSRADVPITTATGDRVSTFGSGLQPTAGTQSSAELQDSTATAAALASAGAHTTHIDHDAPHTAQEKPTLPRHGGY